MLEIRNITKTYRSKTGESVKALDNVSVSFPESGMVFILGKSGSGKSTLLNVIGGLDSIDDGEFLIKGKSSKDFVGSDFDAYRNTFIGFIFQEYNVLDEFTVGANIGLALELQGKKATAEEINSILSQVDLLNFAKRKPNELSGGQKQRVAIARALVKDPQIIMADEPTGALDSNTGKQIFDTLKELSKEKLVLIVSHDRDFAERYADRIIELADGQIISDVTKHKVEGKVLSQGIKQVSRNILEIKGGYRLTPEDVEMINAYLASNSEGLMLSGDTRINGEMRSVAGITPDGTSTIFEGTDPATDVKVKEYDPKTTKFIRSRLPAKNAIKMGASGLKHKRFRLAMTILLSLISFALFGLADTMAAYDKITAATESILDSHTVNASMALGVRNTHTYDDDDEPYTYYEGASMNDEDIAWLRKETGLNFVPVFTGGNPGWGEKPSFSIESVMASEDYKCVAYEGELKGFVNLTAEDLASAGLTLVGRMPEKQGEIVISEFLYRQLKAAGFSNTESGETVKKDELTMEETGDKSIIGKHLLANRWFNGNLGSESQFVIVGVVDTKFDYTRYEAFLPQEEEENDRPAQDEGLDIAKMLLQMELEDELKYGFHTLGYVCAEDITSFSRFLSKTSRPLGTNIGISTRFHNGEMGKENVLAWVNNMGDSDIISSLNNITWLDGEARTTLGEKEYLVHKSVVQNIMNSMVNALAPDYSVLDAKAIELYGASWETAKATAQTVQSSYYETLRFAARLKHDSDPSVDIENEIREAFLPVLAEFYGVTVNSNTQHQARQRLLEQLNYITIGSGEEGKGNEISTWNVRDVKLRFYCNDEVMTKNLLSNTEFVDMVKLYISGNGIQDDFDQMGTESRIYYAIDAYYNYMDRDQEVNLYGDKTAKDIELESYTRYMQMAGASSDSLFQNIEITCTAWMKDGEETALEFKDLKLVGTFDNENATDLIVCDAFVDAVQQWKSENNYSTTKVDRAEHEDGLWAFAITAMPTDRAVVENLVKISYAEGVDLQFSLKNQVMNTLGTFNDFIETGAMIFLWVGVGFALFSSLLLMNFISISISYKKREIGILRAVGARSSDVFRIFFSESFIIAFINYVLAVGATLTTIFFLNRWMRNEGINVTLLNFGVRQLLIMLAVSVAVAALASFLPVWRIARKKPVDAIKDK